jgi:pimeloyl-ACP methyl ester carboxylesterase
VLQYSGVYPQRVGKVVGIEGWGPTPIASLHARHINACRPGLTKCAPLPAAKRMGMPRSPMRYNVCARPTRLTETMASHLTLHGTNRHEDGLTHGNSITMSGPPLPMILIWKTRAIWERITCPTLLIRGADSRLSDPERDGECRHSTIGMLSSPTRHTGCTTISSTPFYGSSRLSLTGKMPRA